MEQTEDEKRRKHLERVRRNQGFVKAWKKKNTKVFSVHFNVGSNAGDREVYAYIQKQPDKKKWIVKLIRADMAEHPEIKNTATIPQQESREEQKDTESKEEKITMEKKYLNYKTRRYRGMDCPTGYVSFSLDDPEADGMKNIMQFAIDCLGKYYGTDPEELYDENGDVKDLSDEEIARAYAKHYDGFSVSEMRKGLWVNQGPREYVLHS